MSQQPISKTHSIQPHLDVPELARIRFPMWLKSVYNIAQMELTTLDVLGAFYLVALDADWELRPENILTNNRGFRARPSFTAPVMYGAQAAPAVVSAHTFKTHAFEMQQRTKSDLHAAILASIGQVTLDSINSKHRFGVGSLSPLDLVKELKATFGTITHHEISATETAIAAPLAQFNQFRDFCSNVTRNYEFLQTAGHNVPELTRIDVFVASLSTWPQFDSHISFWKTTTPFDQRTLQSLTMHLLSQYGDMPPESQPRGGNAFQFRKGKDKGKGKGKNKGKKGKGRGQGTKRSYDEDSVSLSSFSTTPSSATQYAKDNSQYWHRGYHPNPTTSLTLPSVPTASKPYSYCHFHGWNFSHRGITCKKLINIGDNAKLHADVPTATTPHGNASVEPAYKSWQ
jgi:hypothetical protein